MKRSRRVVLGSARVVAVTLVILLAGLHGSASATIVAPETATKASASTSSDKSVTATCPGDKRVVGAGAEVQPGDGQVLIAAIRPDAGRRSVTVTAREDETPTTAAWRVLAIARCANRPVGLTRVVATSAGTSQDKSVSAACPTGKRMLAPGGEISAGQVLLTGLRPDHHTPTGVLASAREDETGTPASWTVTAYAICADRVAGLRLNFNTYEVNSDSPKLAAGLCGINEQPLGGGFDINSPGGEVGLTRLGSTDAFNIAVNASEDDTGTTDDWSLTGYAICAHAVKRVAVAGPVGDQSPKQETLGCRSTMDMTGVGGAITGGLGKVVRSGFSLASDQNLRPYSVMARGAGIGDWRLHAHAICATLPFVSSRTALSDSNSSDKSVHAGCWGSERLVGAAGIAFGVGVLVHITPNPALTGVTVSGIESASGSNNTDWQVKAQALCADDPPPGLQLVTATSAVDSARMKSATATCPAGKHVLGTGGALPGGGGHVVIDDLLPDPALRSVLVNRDRGPERRRLPGQLERARLRHLRRHLTDPRPRRTFCARPAERAILDTLEHHVADPLRREVPQRPRRRGPDSRSRALLERD